MLDQSELNNLQKQNSQFTDHHHQPHEEKPQDNQSKKVTKMQLENMIININHHDASNSNTDADDR